MRAEAIPQRAIPQGMILTRAQIARMRLPSRRQALLNRGSRRLAYRRLEYSCLVVGMVVALVAGNICLKRGMQITSLREGIREKNMALARLDQEQTELRQKLDQVKGRQLPAPGELGLVWPQPDQIVKILKEG